MNTWLLIGHRGVGKSSFLNQLRQMSSFDSFEKYSLDTFIEEREGRSIENIFSNGGEQVFRELEKKYLNELCELEEEKIVDVGAGFCGEKPIGSKALWIKRSTDPRDYGFLNRPLLDNQFYLSPERFQEREYRYRELSDHVLELREGNIELDDQISDYLRALFFAESFSSRLSDWVLTKSSETPAADVEYLVAMGLKAVEYRDDLVESASVKREQPALFSFRSKKPSSPIKAELWDWPLEWGHNFEAPILSMHSKNNSVEETLKSLPETDQIIKVALPIENFRELQQGHFWRMESPETRCFLPMSSRGRWAWYRLLHARKSPLNFLRLGKGSAVDQPSLLEVLNFQPEYKNFAAILGAPVDHSMTPSFHQNFFQEKQANVLRIHLDEEEWDGALPFLQELGLRWAAVTSPLKKKAAEFVSAEEPAINTLFFGGKSWKGVSTDEKGLNQLIPEDCPGPVAVWGGGGTLSSFQKGDPRFFYYASRTGQARDKTPSESPKTLIWAVGREKFQERGCFPPKDWPIQRIFDLNYSQDSPGIEAAHRYACNYTSGLAMFRGQALAQQEFWNECEL